MEHPCPADLLLGFLQVADHTLPPLQPPRAPTDCLQYFTGRSGTVYSYNFAGAQFLAGMEYTNCIR